MKLSKNTKFEKFEYVINENKVTITKLNDSTVESVVIPEYINGYEVISIGERIEIQ